jgi:hypothetical protein
MVYVIIYQNFDHVVVLGVYSDEIKAKLTKDILAEEKMWDKDKIYIKPIKINHI